MPSKSFSSVRVFYPRFDRTQLIDLLPHPYTEAEYHVVASTVDRMTQGGVVLFPAG